VSAKLSQRIFERRPIHHQDHAEVIIHCRNHEIKTRLYDVSPMGAGLFLADAAPDDVKFLRQGLTIDLTFDRESGSSSNAQAVICHVSRIEKKSKQGLLIGVHFLSESARKDQPVRLLAPNNEIRELPDIFRPLAYADDQMFFQEFLHFQILGYSLDEVLLRTSKSNKGLIPGQRLFLKVMLPDLGDDGCQVRITAVDSPSLDDKSYVLRAKWEKPERGFLEALAEFLFLAFPGTSVKALMDEGWPAMALRRALRFRYAHTKDEFSQVLDLRLLAAQGDGRWLDADDNSVMVDSYDIHSRQIMCIAGERLVGSARLVFNDRDESRAEHTGYQVKLPAWLWKGGFVEVSRLCTHPDYRGADVFLFMLQHLGRIVVTSGNAYMLTNCVDSLVPIYERFGAKNLGLRFDSPFMQGRKLNLLVFDCKKVCAGVGVHPIYYSLGFKHMSKQLHDKGLVEFNSLENTVRHLKGMLEPLAQKIEKKKRQKKVLKSKAGEKTKSKPKRRASGAR
jgi:predicted GNAT family N-acyltransferase